MSAPMKSRDDELDVEYSERTGFLVGSEAALADWQHRKEEAAYAELFRRLENRKRQAKWRAANLEHARAQERARLPKKRQYRELHLERERKYQRDWQRAKRASRPNTRVINGKACLVHLITCPGCGREVEKLRRHAQWCSRDCRLATKRERARAVVACAGCGIQITGRHPNAGYCTPICRKQHRTRQVPSGSVAATLLSILTLEPGLRSREIVARVRLLGLEFSKLTVANVLYRLVRTGAVTRTNGYGKRYTLAARSEGHTP